VSGLSNEVLFPLVIAAWFTCAYIVIIIGAEIWYRWDGVLVGAVLWFCAFLLLGLSFTHLPVLVQRVDPTDEPTWSEMLLECEEDTLTYDAYIACRDEAFKY
jgi:hypothetical protein